MRSLAAAFREHRNLIVYTFLNLALIVGIAAGKGARLQEFSLVFGIAAMTVMCAVLFFGLIFGYFYAESCVAAIKRKNQHASLRQIFDHRTDGFLHNGLLMSGLVGILPLFVIGISVDFGKSLIIYLNPYHWDPLLSRVDRAMHFGHYPHELLMPFIIQWRLSWLMNAAYLAWFMVMFFANALCLFCDTDRVRRKRYLWSVVLAWTLIGTFCATFFSSVGPVFYHDFYPGLPNPYADLTAHLKAVHESGTTLNVVQMSPYLLEMARNDRVIDINGPSAMPSMHIAISWLLVLYGFAVDRRAGIAAFLFFLVMMAGSVYLSWHYAIDGYAGVVLVTMIWFAAGFIARRSVQNTRIDFPAHSR